MHLLKIRQGDAFVKHRLHNVANSVNAIQTLGVKGLVMETQNLEIEEAGEA